MNCIIAALQSKYVKLFPFVPILNILYVVGMFLCSNIPVKYYAIILMLAGMIAAPMYYLLPLTLIVWYVIPLVVGMALFFKGKKCSYKTQYVSKKRLIPVIAIGVAFVLTATGIFSFISLMLHPKLQENTVQMTQAMLNRDNDAWNELLHMHCNSSIRDLSIFLADIKEKGIKPKGEITEIQMVFYKEESSGFRQVVKEAKFEIRIGENLYSVIVQYEKNQMGEGFTNYQIELAKKT